MAKLSPNKSVPQRRTESAIVKGAITVAIVQILKEFGGVELGSETVEAILVVLFAVYNIIAAYNNPKEKNKF